ncbi:hypothetical protein AB0F57_38035 [Streptomyces tanashiensis]|uniref:hypothetical protein n=1 Tax=Streptomyces tanashiensis TaxID=67367 RepID=UPI0033E91A46
MTLLNRECADETFDTRAKDGVEAGRHLLLSADSYTLRACQAPLLERGLTRRGPVISPGHGSRVP